MTPTATRAHLRIAGLDIARALALLGMFAAHIGDERSWPWLVIADGRSSALFALLAGVSIALMLSHRAGAGAIRYTRVRVAVRGGMLIILGWVLSLLQTPVDVILANLGVMFLLACLALRWRPWVLLGAGALTLTFGWTVLHALVPHLPAWLYGMPVVHELWSAHYPALIWIGYVLVGLGVGKLGPWRGPALAQLGAVGVMLAVAAYGAGLAVARSLGVAGAEGTWYAVDPHAYTAFETLSNVGFALAVIALCCWLSHLLPRVLWPLAATGSMTLTLYSAQIVVIALVGPEIVYRPSNFALVTLCVVSIAFASVWKWRMGQGPLENVFTAASTAAADADAERHPSALTSPGPTGPTGSTGSTGPTAPDRSQPL